MNSNKIIAIVLMVGGALALAYGGFSYTKSTSEANLGPISIEVKDKQQVNIPMWAGIAALVVGGVLLLTPGKRT